MRNLLTFLNNPITTMGIQASWIEIEINNIKATTEYTTTFYVMS